MFCGLFLINCQSLFSLFRIPFLLENWRNVLSAKVISVFALFQNLDVYLKSAADVWPPEQPLDVRFGLVLRGSGWLGFWNGWKWSWWKWNVTKMCPFPPECTSHVSLEFSWRKPSSLHPACLNRAQRGFQEDEPALGLELGHHSCDSTAWEAAPHRYHFHPQRECLQSELEPLSSSPPTRARGNQNLLKDWLFGRYCSTQVILLGCRTSAFSEAHIAFFACTTARWLNYFIFSFHKQAFWWLCHLADLTLVTH